MVQTKVMAAAAVLLAVTVISAWALDIWVSRVPNPEGPTQSYHVSVTRGGRTLKRFALADLKKLGVRSVEMQGQVETGPTLLSVLRAAGVAEFGGVVLRGAGVRDSGSLSLTRAQVTNDVLLDFAKTRGTTKVCGPDISESDRVRDVTRIVVQVPATNRGAVQ